MQLRALAFGIVLASCGAAAPSTSTSTTSRTYEIRLSRHMPVDTSWTEVTHFEEERQRLVHAEGAAPDGQRETRIVDLRGEYTVLEVTERGTEVLLRLVVSDLAWDVGQGIVHPALPLVLQIDRREGGGITDPTGQAIDPAIVAALEGLLPAPMHDHPSDDQLFGTPTPQPVGASWTLDPTPVMRMFSSFGATVDPRNVRGETTFSSVSEVDGHETMQLHSVVSAHALQLPLPVGFAQQRGDALMGFEETLPTERGLPAFDERFQMSLDVEATAPSPTGPITIDVGASRRLTRHRTDVRLGMH